MSDHTTTTTTHAPELRRRADHLNELARSIEASLVMSLAETESRSPAADGHTRLCDALLERNLHQLHRAADDLRVTAMRFRARADELDAASRVAA